MNFEYLKKIISGIIGFIFQEVSVPMSFLFMSQVLLLAVLLLTYEEQVESKNSTIEFLYISPEDPVDAR